MMSSSKCVASWSRSDKLAYALGLVEKIRKGWVIHDFLEACQGDFKVASMAAYEIAVDIFDKGATAGAMTVFGCEPESMTSGWLPLWAPARYCGGNMDFGRVFAVNHCALSSPDSIIGVTCDTGFVNCVALKGLSPLGRNGRWCMFKLDPSSTDDKTGMFYCGLEKDFEVKIAHFPNGSPRRVIFHLDY